MVDDGAAASPGSVYPTHWEADVVLRDGGTARVRPIRPDDADALQAFHVAQSEQSTYLRFFVSLERIPDRELTRFTQVDHHDRVALVAVAGEDEHIIAVARYDRTGPGTAEVAFNVADDHAGRGLGSVLLEHLAAAARERGIGRFTAEVLPQNGRMIAVFRDAGYEVDQQLEDGVVLVSFDLDPTERSIAVMADREQRAEARSVHGLLTPRSVLVVTRADDAGPGADGRRELAQAVVRHLVEGGGVDGPSPSVHVLLAPGPGAGPGTDAPSSIATSAPGWEGLTVMTELTDLPAVDLLVLAVPADRAAETVRHCAGLGARAVVVLSGGYAERGPHGLGHQQDLVRTAHAAGMRVLGPASYGFFRRGSGEHLTVNASLAGVLPRPGRLALFCQSAALAVGLLASARRRGLGLSTFVSSGNRADVSGNDLMQFWAADESTDVVGLYLESIGNPRKFARVARRLAATKPVIVLTAGRSGHVQPPGQALRVTRVPRQTLEEILRQAGVIRVESQHQLLDVAQLLTHQPLPSGRRVSVVASSEPLAALVAEAAVSAGLTVGDQRAVLPPGDGRSDVELARLEDVLREVYADPSCDVVVVVHVPTLGEADPRVGQAVARSAAGSGRTTVACILGLSGVTPELTATDADGRPWTVPAYAAPEDGVAALAAAVRHSAWRSADHGHPLAPDGLDRSRARRLVEGALSGRPGDVVPLDREQTAELLGCYGLRLWPTAVVHDEEHAVRAAHELGWPVALKSTAGRLRHRVDLGGVRLDLGGPAALVDAFAQMRVDLAALGETDLPFEVQPMAPKGAACVIRTSEDPRFGPVVSFGMAGDATDLLGDISHGVAPLTEVDVAEMVRSVRAAPRLFGYRGLPALDVAAVEDVLARASVMADDLPELRSLELHPVVVGEHGAVVLAARVELAEAGRTDTPRRALPR